MRLKLNLDHHCVQTEILRIYNARVRSCLKGKRVMPDDEDIIELLKNLLETLDFSHLRSSVKALAGKEQADVVLVRDKNQKIWIEVNGRQIGIYNTGE